jgi:predicted KAP-like P-loop ATPase
MSHTDQPITKLAEDELGLDNFIKQLALAITKYEHVSSFVVGLYGDWGSGKTSIINMLLDTLEQNKKENKIIVVKFNPWYFSGQDKLLEQFFDSLYINIKSNFEKIMGNSEKANKLSVSIGESTSGLIAYLKPLIKYIVPWVPGIPSQQLLSFLSTLEDFSKSLQGLKTDKKFDPIEKKKELNQKLKQLDRKVLIVMDDIDRLTKSEILQIFQLVKSVADFDNTIYLLSFSPDVVTQSLEGIQ